MHRCHIPSAVGPIVQLTGDQAHHLSHVLRLDVGAELVVCDGRGHEWLGRVATMARAQVTVTLISSRTPLPEPAIAVTLAIGVLKGDQMNTVVRDATMLGVAAIAPFLSAHTAVSERGDWAKARERWARVAVASAMQCGRAVVPDVCAVTTFDAVMAAAKPHPVVMCVEPAHASPSTPGVDPVVARATVFVGPEGGWAPAELARAVAAGARLLSLGPRTLRAEVAPTVALSALWTLWGWR